MHKMMMHDEFGAMLMELSQAGLTGLHASAEAFSIALYAKMPGFEGFNQTEWPVRWLRKNGKHFIPEHKCQCKLATRYE